MLLTNLLRKPGFLNFRDFYIYCPTVYQDTYKHLKEHFEEQERALKMEYRKRKGRNKVTKIANVFSTDGAIIDPRELDSHFNHVMVFDDVMLKDQTIIKEYFCTRRHNNVNVFYLVQSLHEIQKHCIRENANTFILFGQRDKTLKYFCEEAELAVQQAEARLRQLREVQVPVAEQTLTQTRANHQGIINRNGDFNFVRFEGKS